MVRIVPVTLQYNPRTLWFDPGDIAIADGDHVVVQTERGLEYGFASAITEVEPGEISKLRSKLKPVVRVATEEDEVTAEEMRQKSAEALPVFRSLAAEVNSEMHPVLVEYLFDGEKAIFYFEAEERIDFRDLVRKLASELHVRVDMRQIGVRDEARIVGGLGHCGQELCCKRMGGDFNPVSIRMAKEQDLSLNPQKISGLCGRLMCCLRYEFDTYKEFKSRAPKAGGKVKTPVGVAKVIDLNVPRETVTIKVNEDGKDIRVTFPLDAMEPAEEGSNRPNTIGEEAYERYAHPEPVLEAVSVGLFETSGFTQDDQLAKPEAHHNPRSKKKSKDEESSTGRKPRRRRRSGRGKGASDGQKKDDGARQAEQSSSKDGKTKSNGNEGQSSKRSRSRGGRGGAKNKKDGAATSSKDTQGTKSVRPGRNSSSLRKSSASGSEDQAGTHRKARRRSHKTGGESNGEA